MSVRLADPPRSDHDSLPSWKKLRLRRDAGACAGLVRPGTNRGAPMNDQAHDLALALRGAYLTRHRRADASFARYGVTADQFVLPDLLARESAATQQTLVLRTYSGSARQ